MEGITAGALNAEIVRRGFQDLLKAEVSAAIGAARHERCPDERSTHRNDYIRWLLTTQVGDLSLAIQKLREGTFFPDWLEPRQRVDKARDRVLHRRHLDLPTWTQARVPEALGRCPGQSLSEQSALDHAHFPYIYNVKMKMKMKMKAMAMAMAASCTSVGP
jgi:hypothetical protein